MIAALCGGVGGSKLVHGLYRVLPPDSLTVIVNTADDLELWGLSISPDLDTVTYTLAGLARRDVGWGIEGDTFHALEMLRHYGAADWFHVGDRDLATHVYRTNALRLDRSLTEITAQLAGALGVRARILPMTDDRVATRVQVAGEWVEFQDYFVRQRHSVPVEAVQYEGIEQARPGQEVVQALQSAEVIVFVNSNPVLSILPLLAVPGMRDLLAGSSSARVAVSPIVGEASVTGPAGDLMRLLRQPSTATGVAATYRDVIDGIVIDRRDAEQTSAIESMGLRVLCTDVIMRNERERERLAAETVAFARELR